MIRPLEIADLDTVMQIWLEGNLQAHGFISPEYWRQNDDYVRKILPQSTVYVYEDGQIISDYLHTTGFDEYEQQGKLLISDQVKGKNYQLQSNEISYS